MNDYAPEMADPGDGDEFAAFEEVAMRKARQASIVGPVFNEDTRCWEAVNAIGAMQEFESPLAAQAWLDELRSCRPGARDGMVCARGTTGCDVDHEFEDGR